MLTKLGMADLFASIITLVEAKTKYRCYDEVPKDCVAPYYYVELIGIAKRDTKTMFRDGISIWIHAIAENNGSSIGIYEMVDLLREAMTEDITVEALLQQQDFTGIQAMKKDESGERHAVLSWDLTICYGFKVKDDEISA